MIDILYTSLTGVPNKDEGGSNRVIYDLINSISKEEFRLHYLSFGINNFGEEHVHGKSALSIRSRVGQVLARASSLYRSVVTSPIYFKHYMKRIDRYFKTNAQGVTSDIIHAHDPLVLPYFESIPVPRILTIHSKGGVAVENEKKGSFHTYGRWFASWVRDQERRAIRSADILTFPSHAAKELFFNLNDYEYRPENIRIIYNGIDLDAVESTKEEEDVLQRFGIRNNAELYIINVAEHAVQKNIPTLLRAVQAIVHEYAVDAMLINVGQGPETARLKSLSTELGIARHVVLLGTLPNRDVLRLMKRADCFAMTSMNVVFDLVVLEAMACGLAVFVSDDGGNREIVKNGVNGYLIPPNDHKSIARLLVYADRKAVQKNAKEDIQSYSLYHMASSYEDLYREVFKAKHS